MQGLLNWLFAIGIGALVVRSYLRANDLPLAGPPRGPFTDAGCDDGGDGGGDGGGD